MDISRSHEWAVILHYLDGYLGLMRCVSKACKSLVDENQFQNPTFTNPTQLLQHNNIKLFQWACECNAFEIPLYTAIRSKKLGLVKSIKLDAHQLSIGVALAAHFQTHDIFLYLTSSPKLKASALRLAGMIAIKHKDMVMLIIIRNRLMKMAPLQYSGSHHSQMINVMLHCLGCGTFWNVRHAMVAALHNGRREMAFLKDQQAFTAGDEGVYKAAAYGGHLSLLQWMWSEVGRCKTHVLLPFAARGGSVGVVRWVLQQDVFSTDEMSCAIENAVAGNHFHLVATLVEEYMVHASPSTCAIASMYNLMDMLEWLVNVIGVTITSTSMIAAASHGHLGPIEFAMEQGVELNASILFCAKLHKHSHIVSWLRNHNCPEPFTHHNYLHPIPKYSLGIVNSDHCFTFNDMTVIELYSKIY